jgi:two-component sensor histidine kinase
MSLGVDKAVPLGLFLNEALMNAFKHAFPNGYGGEKSIRVLIIHGDDDDVVTIRDSGVGFEPGPYLQAAGDAQPRSSLGLTLMTLLADQLGARLDISSGPGTAVSLAIQNRRAAPGHS